MAHTLHMVFIIEFFMANRNKIFKHLKYVNLLAMIHREKRQKFCIPAAVVVQAMLQSAGINAEIEVLDWATQLDRYNKGNYQMQSFSFSARFDPAIAFEQIRRQQGQAAAQGLGQSGRSGEDRSPDDALGPR